MTTTWGTQIPKPAPDPDEVALLMERVTRLQGLTELPAWQELRSLMEERRDAHMLRLARRLQGGAVDSAEIDRHAGFWKGVFAVLDKPAEVEKELRKKLETAESAQPTERET